MEGMEEADAIPPWLASVKSKAGDVLDQRATPVGRTSRIPKEAREYIMDQPRRGTAVIFNHMTFPDSPNRRGSDIDRDNLKAILTAFGFAVEVHEDKTSDEIAKILDLVRMDDHGDADCLMVVMMTHGDEGCLLDSRSWRYSPDRLWTPFVADACTSLAGKPKIFLIQACQGQKVEGSVPMARRSSESCSYSLPNHADFLIATSTITGNVSFRNPGTGSYFISAFCQVMKEEADSEDLLSMLTEVSREVATNKAQIPCINSMLTRKVWLRRKQ